MDRLFTLEIRIRQHIFTHTSSGLHNMVIINKINNRTFDLSSKTVTNPIISSFIESEKTCDN